MNKFSSRQIISVLVALIIFAFFLFPISHVSADATSSVVPKDLPKSDATFYVKYSGDVTGFTVTTPDGRTYEATSDGSGLVGVYIGDAPQGSYTFTVKGSFTSFYCYVIGNSPAPPPPTETVAPPPPTTTATAAPPQPTETAPPPTQTIPPPTKPIPKPTEVVVVDTVPSEAVPTETTTITITPTPTVSVTPTPTVSPAPSLTPTIAAAIESTSLPSEDDKEAHDIAPFQVSKKLIAAIVFIVVVIIITIVTIRKRKQLLITIKRALPKVNVKKPKPPKQIKPATIKPKPSKPRFNMQIKGNQKKEVTEKSKDKLELQRQYLEALQAEAEAEELKNRKE